MLVFSIIIYFAGLVRAVDRTTIQEHNTILLIEKWKRGRASHLGTELTWMSKLWEPCLGMYSLKKQRRRHVENTWRAIRQSTKNLFCFVLLFLDVLLNKIKKCSIMITVTWQQTDTQNIDTHKERVYFFVEWKFQKCFTLSQEGVQPTRLHVDGVQLSKWD